MSEPYRHVLTGQRGFLEERDGVEVIVYDRAAQEITRKFDARTWLPDHDHRPLNRMAIAQAAFSADASLCRSMGQYQKENDWLMLHPRQRIAWMERGPKTFARKSLYEYVMAATEWLTEDTPPPVSMSSIREILSILKEEAQKPGRKSAAMKAMIAALEDEDASEG